MQIDRHLFYFPDLIPSDEKRGILYQLDRSDINLHGIMRTHIIFLGILLISILSNGLITQIGRRCQSHFASSIFALQDGQTPISPLTEAASNLKNGKGIVAAMLGQLLGYKILGRSRANAIGDLYEFRDQSMVIIEALV